MPLEQHTRLSGVIVLLLLATALPSGWAQQTQPSFALALAVDPRLRLGTVISFVKSAERAGITVRLLYPFSITDPDSSKRFAKQSAALIGHEVDGVLTTIADLYAVPRDSQTYNAEGEVEAAGPAYFVHALFRDPGTSQVCGLPVSDIMCLRKRGTEVFTTIGLSAASAAAITHVADDLGANCETGQNCHEAAESDVETKFTDFLGFRVGISTVPHLVIYTVAEGTTYRNNLVRGLATQPRVGMVEFASLLPRLAGEGFAAATIPSDVYIAREVRTIQDLQVAYTIPSTIKTLKREAFIRLAEDSTMSSLPTAELRAAAFEQLLHFQQTFKGRFRIMEALLKSLSRR